MLPLSAFFSRFFGLAGISADTGEPCHAWSQRLFSMTLTPGKMRIACILVRQLKNQCSSHERSSEDRS